MSRRMIWQISLENILETLQTGSISVASVICGLMDDYPPEIKKADASRRRTRRTFFTLKIPSFAKARTLWLESSRKGLGKMNPLWRNAFRHRAYTNNVLFINPGNRLFLMITDRRISIIKLINL